MSQSTQIGARTESRKRLWLTLGAVVCLLSWLALGLGLLLDVGTGAKLALATVAAVATEGLIWLAALLFGVSAYQMRQDLWKRVTRVFR